MTLSNDGHMLAVALADQIASGMLNDEQLVLFLVSTMAKHASATVNPVPVVEVAIAAVRRSARQIVTDEWRKVEAGHDIETMTARILDRLNGADPDQGTLFDLIAIEKTERVGRVEVRHRLDDLERRVAELERKDAAGRFGPKEITQWISVRQFDMAKFGLVLHTATGTSSTAMPVACECEFGDLESADFYARHYADRNGYEFRD